MAGQTVACPSCGQKTVIVAEAAPDDPSVSKPPATKPVPQATAPTTPPSAKRAVPVDPGHSPKPAARGDAFEFPDISPAPPPGAKLQIQDDSGSVESRRLSKSQPMTFGSHSTCDIVVDDSSIAAMHARVSWNGKAYELTAAGKDGVDVNGTLVKQRILKHGDAIRIGDFDISFVDPEAADDDGEDAADAMFQSIMELEEGTPISLEAIATNLREMEKSSAKSVTASAQRPAAKAGKKEDEFAGAPPTNELDLADVVEDELVEADEELEEAADDELEVADDASGTVEEVAEEPDSRPIFKKSERLKEQPPLMKSPLIMTLGIGGAVLAAAALVFWVMIDRDSTAKQFAEAKREVDQAQYQPGIVKLEEFIKAHPSHPVANGADGARVLLSRAKVEKELVGSPNWANGLKALNDFITDHREKDYFVNLHDEVVKYAKQIAVGAPKTAAGNRQTDLFQVSTDAEQLMERYSPTDAPPKEAKAEIAKVRIEAQAAILKANTTDETLAKMADAVKQKTIFPAFKARQQLLIRYPDLKEDRKVEAALRKALEACRQQVVREDLRRDAVTDDPMQALPKPLTLAVRTRALSEEQTANRVVFALGQDSLFGIDSITGDPLWRRTVGLNNPFFPIDLEISKSAVLAFDTVSNQLLMLDRRSGDLMWRQAIEPVAGPPLVLKSTGQIYVPTAEGMLYRIDAESGRISARLKFPQKLMSPPIGTADGIHLLLIGDSELAYTLTLDGLECKLVSHLRHQPGTIEVPPFSPFPMGQYVVLAENDQANSCRLRALDVSQPASRVTDVGEVRVEGQVHDNPALRGNLLYVLSTEPTGPRLSVYNVSDDKNQKAFSLDATLQIPFKWGARADLAAGPEGQIWFAAESLRKVLLKTGNLVLQSEQQQIAVGQSLQPVQRIGRNLYIGRQLPISSAVHLTQADGESMQSNFRTIVGASLLATNTGSDGQLVCVSSGADTFLISANEVANGGFRNRAEQSLKIPENSVAPLQATALADNRLAVWTGDAEGKLWVIGPTGQPQAEIPLPQPLDCPPIRFSQGVLLPLPGKLVLARTGGPPCDPFLAPINNDGDNARRWKHLIAVDDDQVCVIDSVGKMSKLQYRTGAKAFFQVASEVVYQQPIDVAPTLHNGRLITADAAGTLRVLDVTAMETRAEIALGAAVSKPVWVAEPLLLAEVGRQRLVAFDSAKPKEPLWSLPLEGNGIVGAPVLIDGLLIAVQQNGDVLKLDPKSGEISEKLSLGQLATNGPIRLGNLLTVLTADGSLHHVESLVPSLAQAAKQSVKRPAATTEKPEPTTPTEDKPAEPKPADDKPKDEKPKEDKPGSDDPKKSESDEESK